jgi:hypothetical protein
MGSGVPPPVRPGAASSERRRCARFVVRLRRRPCGHERRRVVAGEVRSSRQPSRIRPPVERAPERMRARAETLSSQWRLSAILIGETPVPPGHHPSGEWRVRHPSLADALARRAFYPPFVRPCIANAFAPGSGRYPSMRRRALARASSSGNVFPCFVPGPSPVRIRENTASGEERLVRHRARIFTIVPIIMRSLIHCSAARQAAAGRA